MRRLRERRKKDALNGSVKSSVMNTYQKKKARGKRSKEDEEENEFQPQAKRRSLRPEQKHNPEVNIYFYSSKSASQRYK